MPPSQLIIHFFFFFSGRLFPSPWLVPPKTLLKGSRREREAHKPFVPRATQKRERKKKKTKTLVDTNQAVTLPSPHPGLTPAPSAPSVVSVGSSPFHGASVSATRLCEVPDGEPCTPPRSQRKPGQQMTHAPCACVSSYLARLGRELATSGPRVGTRCTSVAWRTCV